MPRWILVFLAFVACGSDGPSLPKGRPPNPAPPPNAVGGFSIDVPSMDLAPGQETTPCWVLPLDLHGPSHMIAGGSLTVGQGLHHGNITTRPKSGDGIRPCDSGAMAGGSEANDILAGGTVLFASSTQVHGTEWRSFPSGMAFRIRDGFEIVARMHYLNASASPITVAAHYEWYTVDPASVTQEIAPFIWVYHGFQIPPQQTYTVKGTCHLPADMKVVSAMPHMHKLGIGFQAGFYTGALDGQTWLDSPGYDPDRGVIVEYDPAVDLGHGAFFSCTWNNTYDQSIVEGIGMNEMCMMFGYAYPPANAFSAFTTSDDPATCLVAAPPSN